MRKFAVLGLTLGLLLCWAVTAGASTLDVYTDKADWENAVGGQFETEDFTDDTLNDGVSYTASESGNISNGYFHDTLKSSSQNGPMTTWIFSPQVTSYGGNWRLAAPGGSGNSLNVYVNDLDHLVGTIPSSFYEDFWGFTSDTPFTYVILKGGSGDQQQTYQLDDMVYSQVPVPGTLGLLSGGLLGLLAFRRFRL